MKKGILFFTFVMMVFSAKVFSQESNHPIDVFLDSCMEKDYSTAGMVKCTNDACKMWDGELNKYYKILMGMLDEESAKTLKTSELQWIEFKEKEYSNIDKIYSKMEGTMYIPMRAYARLEIIKTRALQLKDYYELLTQTNLDK
jgi:uncharacterized protein YecT (DUF1311 family)